jgi:hypothetical protein
MEREAYTKGNLIFRDFEDLIKTGKINIEIDFSDSGEPKMSLKEWKNNELNGLLMKKWGLLKEDSGAREDRNLTRNIRNDEKHIDDLDKDVRDDKKELDEGHAGPHGPECGCSDMEASLSAEGGMSYRSDDGSKEHNDEEGNRDPSDDTILGLKKENTSGKISVKEAKLITRRILARVRKEGK